MTGRSTGGWSTIFVGTPRCGTNFGQGGHVAWGLAHELLHTLGALPPGAPHPCTGMPSGETHTCDDPRDVMWGVWGLPLDGYLEDRMLDPGRDDYYGHSGTWWDVQDSRWLSRLDASRHALEVAIVGWERAAVRSDVPGIDCPPLCSVVLDSGTELRLEVETRLEGNEDVRLVGFRGGCTGIELCSVTMDAPKRVEAVFGPATYPFRVNVSGAGRVVTGSWSCARRCADRFDATRPLASARSRAAAGGSRAGPARAGDGASA